MGRFSGINQKSSTGGGTYWEPGDYRAKVLGIKHKEDGFKGESYIMEFEVLEVLLSREVEKRISAGKEVVFNSSRRVGDTVSHVLKLDGENKELALGNLADFLRACHATISAQEGKYIVPKDVVLEDKDPVEAASVDQPLVDLELEVHCQGTITKKNAAFTQVVYKIPRHLMAAAA